MDERITASQMTDRLLTVERLAEILGATEPIGSVMVPVGSRVEFRVEPGWNDNAAALADTDTVDAFVSIRNGTRQEFPLTKDALLTAASICGLPRRYVLRTPGSLVESHLNYWWQGGLGNKEYKLLSVRGAAGALARGSVEPFSNLRLLDQALRAIARKYGTEAAPLVDAKVEHSLRATRFCLVVPEHQRAISGTPVVDDMWSTGLRVKNSLVGDTQTGVDGFLFRWVCTNGMIDTHSTSGGWSRRAGQGEEVYTWAANAVDDVLGGLEGALDAVQETVSTSIEGEVNDVLRDVFRLYSLPASLRQAVTEQMVESDDLTVYGVTQVVTQAANGSSVTSRQRELLQQVGGLVARHGTNRCGECHRMIVER